jgi:hypothetical protein
MPNSRIVNGPMQLLPVQGVNHRNVAVSGTAANLIATALNGETQHIYWTNSGCDVRFTIDGNNPTAGDGHIIKDGNSGIWSKAFASAAKVIAVSGSGVITISELNYL